MASFSPSREKVFISYSHKDAKYLQGFLPYLKYLEKDNSIDFWADTKIKPGEKWKSEIKEALTSAKVAVLLISIDFLVSQFIIEDELPPLLAAAEAKGVKILPIILRPCTLPKSLSQFQAINNPSKPLSKMKGYEREDLWVKVVNAIVDAMNAQTPEVNSIYKQQQQRQSDGSIVSREVFISNYSLQIELPIKEKLKSMEPWSLLYIDLDNFKAFNDVYGILTGNEIIRLLERICQQVVQECGNTDDFVGHNGGDVFLVLTTPDRVNLLCKQISAAFNAESAIFYRPNDFRRGSVSGVDRNGRPYQFPLVSVSIGVVNKLIPRTLSIEEVSYLAEEAKYYARYTISKVYHISPRKTEKS